MAHRVVQLVLLGAQEHAVADAGGRARLRAASEDEAYPGRRAVLGLVPFDRLCDQFAILVTAGHSGDHHRRQLAGNVELAAAAIDAAFRAHVAEERVQLALADGIEPEGAHDLALADAAASFGDEGEDFFPRRRFG